MNKEKFNISSVIIVVLSFILINQFVEDYQIGDYSEREKLLTAVMWEITNNDSIKENHERIHVVKSSSFQYKYAVVVDMKDGNYLVYEWKDESKKRITKSKNSLTKGAG